MVSARKDDVELSHDQQALTFLAGDPQVLDNLNMVIQSGKRTAVVGPSGSGKSTIISMILRLYQPTHGQVEDSLSKCCFEA